MQLIKPHREYINHNHNHYIYMYTSAIYLISGFNISLEFETARDIDELCHLMDLSSVYTP